MSALGYGRRASCASAAVPREECSKVEMLPAITLGKSVESR
jgi:hypothetical protein